MAASNLPWTTSSNASMDWPRQRPATRSEYEVAIFCALPFEANAVKALFDYYWDEDGPADGKAPQDPNAYSTGTIGWHNVVLVHMPGKASTAAAGCRLSFPNIKIAFVVGICGAVPFGPEDSEIVLGDVVISDGLVQYDFGRQFPDTFIRKDMDLDSLRKPDPSMRSLLAKLKTYRGRNGFQSMIISFLEGLQGESDLAAVYPGTAHDRLFEATYQHVRGQGSSCEEVGCSGPMVTRQRLQQDSTCQPMVHQGLIALTGKVMKSSEMRDAISTLHGIIAFEMEAADVVDTFPCVVIGGVCDYADSHTSNRWHNYAAATAAASMKAILCMWAPSTTSGIQLAGPSTDSGYGSLPFRPPGFNVDEPQYSAVNTPNRWYLYEKMAPTMIGDVEEQPQEDDSDRETVYSDAPSLEDSKNQEYVAEFADELISALPKSLGKDDFDHLSRILEDALKEFAIRCGQQPSEDTTTSKGIMYLVHKYRHQIMIHLAEWYSLGEVEDGRFHSMDRTMSLEEKMAIWEDEPSEDSVDQERILDIPDVDNGDDDDNIEFSDLDKYRHILVQSAAYQWLLGFLRREIRLKVAGPNIASTIKRQIMQNLVGRQFISRKAPVEKNQVTFKASLDLLAFFTNQQYQESPAEVLPKVITLTGHDDNVQAATCLEYMTQTWPHTGHIIIRFLQRLLDSEGGISTVTLPDGTHLTAFLGDVLEIKAMGLSYSIAEVGEQIAWLGAALQSSGEDCGAHSMPLMEIYTKHEQIGQDPVPLAGFSSPGTQVLFKYDIQGSLGPLRAGSCWRSLFRSPVVVKGYPIPLRSELDTGLEVSLDIMVALSNAKRQVKFCGVVLLKGFSTLLTVTKITGNMIYWHLLYNEDCGYISHSDPRIPRLNEYSNTTFHYDLKSSRHILGWCENMKSYVGAPDANYDIGWSSLMQPSQKCAFQNISLSAGRYVNIGTSIAIGIKDKPVHIPLDDDIIRTLLILEDQYVVLYDVGVRRAWLVNGTSALLHLVRASIKHNQDDPRLRHVFRFASDELVEATTTCSGSSAAFEFLSNFNNLDLPLYDRSRETKEEITTKLGTAAETSLKTTISFTCLRDRVNDIASILLQIAALQDDVYTQAGVGVRLKSTPRRVLEGFDFMDIATKTGTIWPKVTKLQAWGRGWVDFARSLPAITLFGRDFGELMRPAGNQRPCSACHWNNALPTGKDYLASGTSELKMLLKHRGNLHSRPWRCVNNLYWYSPNKTFEPCQNSSTDTCRIDRVQVLLPAGSLKLLAYRLKLEYSASLPNHGAVIFGHSHEFPLCWPAKGNPNPGIPQRDADESEDELEFEGLLQGSASDADNDDPNLTGSTTMSGLSLYSRPNSQFLHKSDRPATVEIDEDQTDPDIRHGHKGKGRALLLSDNEGHLLGTSPR